MNGKERTEGNRTFQEFRELGMHSSDNLVFAQFLVFPLNGYFYFTNFGILFKQIWIYFFSQCHTLYTISYSSTLHSSQSILRIIK